MSKRQQKKLLRKEAAKQCRQKKKSAKKDEAKLKAAEKRKEMDIRIKSMSQEEREAYKQRSHAASQVRISALLSCAVSTTRRLAARADCPSLNYVCTIIWCTVERLFCFGICFNQH